MDETTTTPATGPRLRRAIAREVVEHSSGRSLWAQHNGQLFPITGIDRIADMLFLYTGSLDDTPRRGEEIRPHLQFAPDRVTTVVVLPNDLTYDLSGRRKGKSLYVITPRGDPYCPADML